MAPQKFKPVREVATKSCEGLTVAPKASPTVGPTREINYVEYYKSIIFSSQV